MKLKIGKYIWNSKKCIPLQILKYGLLTAIIYVVGLIIYFTLLPYSTLG